MNKDYRIDFHKIGMIFKMSTIRLIQLIKLNQSNILTFNYDLALLGYSIFQINVYKHLYYKNISYDINLCFEVEIYKSIDTSQEYSLEEYLFNAISLYDAKEVNIKIDVITDYSTILSGITPLLISNVIVDEYFEQLLSKYINIYLDTNWDKIENFIESKSNYEEFKIVIES